MIKRSLLDALCFAYVMILLKISVGTMAFDPRSDLIWFAGFFVFGTIVSYLLNDKLKIKTLGQIIFLPQRYPGPAVAIYKTFWGNSLFILLALTLYVGFIVTQFSFHELLDSDGLHGAIRLIQGISHPNFSILPQSITAIIETIYIAFIATALSVPLAFVLSFFCARNIMGGSVIGMTIYFVLRGGFNILRSIEPLILAIVFSIWVGIGPFAGMLALMFHTIASLAKQYSEQIECVEEGPVEGLQSTGANFIQVVWFAIVPQLTLPFVAFTIFRWDINVRMATVIGLIGGGGIGNLLLQYQGMAMWEEVGCIAVVIIAVVWIMDIASSYVREAIK